MICRTLLLLYWLLTWHKVLSGLGSTLRIWQQSRLLFSHFELINSNQNSIHADALFTSNKTDHSSRTAWSVMRNSNLAWRKWKLTVWRYDPLSTWWYVHLFSCPVGSFNREFNVQHSWSLWWWGSGKTPSSFQRMYQFNSKSSEKLCCKDTNQITENSTSHLCSRRN